MSNLVLNDLKIGQKFIFDEFRLEGIYTVVSFDGDEISVTNDTSPPANYNKYFGGKYPVTLVEEDTDSIDNVNSPEHYTAGGIETIEVLKAKLTTEEFEGYCRGNIIKYITRSKHKGKEVEDLKKAKWYLQRLIDTVEGVSNPY